MMNDRGQTVKTLMILGGSRFALPVIEAAHALGCRAVTCDYLPDNHAHRYADAYCNVSVVDGDAVLEAARAQGADGITSFACDPGVVSAAYAAQRLGLPAPGPVDSVGILQDKGRFRRFLKEHGFNVPTSDRYADADAARRDVDRYRWPVMVKPVDSAGSKGITRVETPDGLATAAARALAFSRAGAFVVEDFIAQRGFASDSDSFYTGGRLRFRAFNCQRFDPNAENPYTPAAYQWPASISRENQDKLASEVERLLGLLGMGDSIYNIETREDVDGRAYIMECAPRGGGNRLAECLEYMTGVPLVENAVRAALGMPLRDLEQKPVRGHWAEVILHSRRPGRFKGLRIDPSIEGAVFQRDLWVAPGAPVGGFAAANEAIGTLVLKFDDADALRRAMDDIDHLVRVETDGS